MDEIFYRMNLAIKAKNLDPMDLKLLPQTDEVPPTTPEMSTNATESSKVPRIARFDERFIHFATS